MKRLQEKCTQVAHNAKMVIPAVIISLLTIMNSCSSTVQPGAKHKIKFVVFYSGEIRDTLTFESDKTLKISYFGNTSHIDEGNNFRDNKILFDTKAPIKVLENE